MYFCILSVTALPLVQSFMILPFSILLFPLLAPPFHSCVFIPLLHFLLFSCLLSSFPTPSLFFFLSSFLFPFSPPFSFSPFSFSSFFFPFFFPFFLLSLSYFPLFSQHFPEKALGWALAHPAHPLVTPLCHMLYSA